MKFVLKGLLRSAKQKCDIRQVAAVRKYWINKDFKAVVTFIRNAYVDLLMNYGCTSAGVEAVMLHTVEILPQFKCFWHYFLLIMGITQKYLLILNTRKFR